MGWKDPSEKEMETHSSILAWETPWAEEPNRLQSMGSQKSQTRLRDSTTTNNTQKIYKNQEWLGLDLKFRSKEFEQAKVHHKSSILIWQWLEAKV